MDNKGLFITFEGGEGSGKSTQSKLLHAFFLQNDIKCILTREPGGTKSAEDIRNLLVTGEPSRWHATTEALLMCASRSEHWHRLIKPAIDDHKIVLCDRFLDSSIAYQGFARGLPIDGLIDLYHFAVGKMMPDITFLLDIDPIQGLQRTKKRQSNIDERFEKESLEFHQNVRRGYLSLHKEYPNRIHLLDATTPIEDLQKTIQKIILDYRF